MSDGRRFIGFLVHKDDGWYVMCKECGTGVTPVFTSNIGDYKQSCVVCRKVLVEGKTPEWPELFDGREPAERGQ